MANINITHYGFYVGNFEKNAMPKDLKFFNLDRLAI